MRYPALLSAAAAIFLVTAACSVNPLTGNPVGAPIKVHGITLENGCVMDAIVCVQELSVSPGSHATIFLAKYTPDGGLHTFGHAMTRYYWPPMPDPDYRTYVYDRTNASTMLPTSVNPSDAGELARYMLPGVTGAWWATPATLTQSAPALTPMAKVGAGWLFLDGRAVHKL